MSEENKSLSEFDLAMIELVQFQILPYVLYFTMAGCVLEIIMLISFCYFILTNKLENLKGLLFLYSIGYLIDIIAVACWIMSWWYDYSSYFWLNAAEISFDYCELSGSVWNTLLALNRCTALMMPMKYSRIWSFKNICLFGVPMILVFPFLLLGYVLFDERFYMEGL